MLKRPSDERLTVEERVAVVIAIAVSVGFHLVVFLGGSGIGHLVSQERRRERLMVIRRVRDITPAPEIAVKVPESRRVRIPVQEPPGDEGKSGGAPAKPQPKVSDRGAQPPPPKAEITPKMEEDLQDAASKAKEDLGAAAEQKTAELGDQSVSVVTDLPNATFTVSGPSEYQGSGTFWIRRGAPAGTYRIAFGAVDGFATPPPQTKELADKGRIVFVGKYRRSTEIQVDSNEATALFTIYRPDGRPIDLSRPGRAFFDDLPPGNYTAVFKDVPGHVTPAPITQNLAPGGRLAFYGNYRDGGTGGGGTGAGRGSGVGDGEGTGTGLRGSGSGGGGAGAGRGRQVARAAGPQEGLLDRRVQLVVKSYPKTEIEENWTPIAYPELIIRKSNFQQGWCQVYLVLEVNADGAVQEVIVERPRPNERPQYEALIKAVEGAVRAWDYDKVAAEVHVDVRFYVE